MNITENVKPVGLSLELSDYEENSYWKRGCVTSKSVKEEPFEKNLKVILALVLKHDAIIYQSYNFW